MKASGFKDPCWQRRVSRWCPKISAPQRVSQRSFFLKLSRYFFQILLSLARTVIAAWTGWRGQYPDGLPAFQAVIGPW